MPRRPAASTGSSDPHADSRIRTPPGLRRPRQHGPAPDSGRAPGARLMRRICPPRGRRAAGTWPEAPVFGALFGCQPRRHASVDLHFLQMRSPAQALSNWVLHIRHLRFLRSATGFASMSSNSACIVLSYSCEDRGAALPRRRPALHLFVKRSRPGRWRGRSPLSWTTPLNGAADPHYRPWSGSLAARTGLRPAV